MPWEHRIPPSNPAINWIFAHFVVVNFPLTLPDLPLTIPQIREKTLVAVGGTNKSTQYAKNNGSRQIQRLTGKKCDGSGDIRRKET